MNKRIYVMEIFCLFFVYFYVFIVCVFQRIVFEVENNFVD